MAKIKKKTLIALISVWCVLFIGTVGSLVWTKFVYGGQNTDIRNPLQADEFFSEWQSYIKDEALLNEIVTAGSHDSGSINMMPLAETQAHSITDQLKGGVRYFDMRVTKSGKKLKIYHGPIIGMDFETVLNEIKAFIDENPTEFIILDFQHFGNKKCHDAVREMTVNVLGEEKLMKKSVCHSIESTTMQDVRTNGYNYAMIWSVTEETEDKDYMYARKSFLFSPYDEDVHMSKNPAELIKEYDDYLITNNGRGFFVLQAQRTAPDQFVTRPADLELEFKDKINAYVAGLTGEKLDKINIVMRDFVVSDMTNVKTILRLNIAKDLIDAEKLAEYTLKVA